MFEPKKTIPSLAAAAISLAGCAQIDVGGTGGMAGAGGAGTGGAGTGGAGGNGGQFADSLKAFCMKGVECQVPDSDYATCIQGGNTLASRVSGDCLAIWESYFSCIGQGTCQDLETYACDDSEAVNCYYGG
jgi:hypothetical protein